MYRATLPLFLATIVLAAACGGSATTQPTNAAAGATPAGGTPAGGTPAAPLGSGGVRIDLTLGGGPNPGDHELSHPNPCRFNNPDDGAWAVTVTFPGATGSPSIVDLVLLEGSSYVDAWFGDDQFRAADVEFSVDDR